MDYSTSGPEQSREIDLKCDSGCGWRCGQLSTNRSLWSLYFSLAIERSKHFFHFL